MADVRVLNGDSKEQVDSLPTLEEATLKTAPMALNGDMFDNLNDNVTKIAVTNISESDTEKIIKSREQAIKKSLAVQDKAKIADAEIEETRIGADVIKARGEKSVSDTSTRADKEQAYFSRHKDTLGKYKVTNSCSIVKMGLLVLIDNVATVIAFPFLFLFRLATLLVETFTGLADGVRKLIKSVIIIVIIAIGILLLYNYGILRVG
mgnify:CR=1 FL=1